jgi:hypothetical protein
LHSMRYAFTGLSGSQIGAAVGTSFHSLPSRHRPRLRLPASLLPFLLESCKKKDKLEEYRKLYVTYPAFSFDIM